MSYATKIRMIIWVYLRQPRDIGPYGWCSLGNVTKVFDDTASEKIVGKGIMERGKINSCLISASKLKEELVLSLPDGFRLGKQRVTLSTSREHPSPDYHTRTTVHICSNRHSEVKGVEQQKAVLPTARTTSPPPLGLPLAQSSRRVHE